MISEELEDILVYGRSYGRAYPYPITRVSLKAYNAPTTDAKVKNFRALFETMVKYVTILLASDYLHSGSTDATVVGQLHHLKGTNVELGQWAGCLTALIDFYRNQQSTIGISNPIVADILDFYDKAATLEMVECHNFLKQEYQQKYKMGGENMDRNGACLRMLHYCRNVLTHPPDIPAPQVKRVLRKVEPAVEALLLEMTFLTKYDLVFLRRVMVIHTQREYEYYFKKMLGDKIRKEVVRIASTEGEPNEVYVRAEDPPDRFVLHISLHPLLIYAKCSICDDGRYYISVLNGCSARQLYYNSICGHDIVRPDEGEWSTNKISLFVLLTHELCDAHGCACSLSVPRK